MYFQHAAEIWQRFPQLVPGLLVVQGIHTDTDVNSFIDRWYGRARERLEGGAEGQLPEVAAWRRIYSQMGLKPTKYRSASEALLRRFKREGDLPRLHPLVDLCNAASLAYALPVAVFDLEKVDGFIEVRPNRRRQKESGGTMYGAISVSPLFRSQVQPLQTIGTADSR